MTRSDTVFTEILERRLFRIGFIIIVLLVILTGIFSRSTYDAGDSVMHYLFAHYAFRHPENFLNHWSKPFFTALTAPVAVFGFGGIKIFNCLVTLLSALITRKVAKKLGLKFAWLAPLLLLASPEVFLAQFSGLTEPLFGLISIYGIFLLTDGRKFQGAAVLSFLPFVRTEGFLLVCVIGLYLFLKRDMRSMIFLGVGFFLYSFVGMFFKGDFLWIFTQNPYHSEWTNYGSGSWLHFPEQLLYVTGIPVYGLFWLGIPAIMIILFRSVHTLAQKLDHLLVYGTFFIYFGAHMYFWATGTGHSLGMTRVMIAIMPMGALIALNGLNLLVRIFPENKEKIRHVLVVLVALYVLVFPFTGNHASFHFKEDFSLSKDQQLISEMKSWWDVQELQGRTIYTNHPSVYWQFGIDPFDEAICKGLVKVTEPVEKGSVMIWDSWFAVTEAGIGEGFWEDRPDEYRMLKEFRTDSPKNPIVFRIFERL